MDNAFCGGNGPTLSGAALAAVKAVIFMVSMAHPKDSWTNLFF